METAMNSFRKTGLWPPDLFVYSDVDFAVATVSERPINFDENDINISVTDSATPPPPENINLLTNETQPSTSQSLQQGNTHLKMPKGIQSTSQPAKQENNLLKMSAFTSSTLQSVLMENTSACAPTTSQSVLESTPLKMSESASSTTNLADLETEQSTHNQYYIPVEIIHPSPSSSGISMGPRKKKRINVSGVVLTVTPYKEQLKIQQTPKTNTHQRQLVATKEQRTRKKEERERGQKEEKQKGKMRNAALFAMKSMMKIGFSAEI
ncbi:hypothetical protein JTB14_019950 [Gonioctena quinquepunctata]|nr:hypothetical protein JTB14_019950 [Gonioctena quinquepunctata]